MKRISVALRRASRWLYRQWQAFGSRVGRDRGSERQGRQRRERSVRVAVPDTRGSAEQVGFILVFGMLLAGSVGGTIFGIEQLSKLDDSGGFEQAESGFVEVQGQQYELATGVPFRSAEVELSGGSIGYADDTRVEYEVEEGDPSDPPAARTTVLTGSFDTRQLTYDAGRERLVYAGGAIFREDTREGTSVMRVEPQLGASTRNEVVLSYLNVTRVGGVDEFGASGAGSSSIFVSNFNYDRETAAFDTTGSSDKVIVTTTITSERYEQWELYFSDHAAYTVTNTDTSAGGPNEGSVSARVTAEELVLTDVEVHVKYSESSG